MIKDDRTGNSDYSNTPLFSFLQQQIERGTARGICVGRSILDAQMQALRARDLTARFAARGILAPEVLAERALRGIDLEEEAKMLGIIVAQVAAIYQAALDALDPQVRKDLERAIAEPKGRGALELDDPDYDRMRRELRLDEIRVLKEKELDEWVVFPGGVIFIPLGPTNAIDHRHTLGPARNQGGRGTCTAFGSTVVAESLEYLRDRRPGPQDLSEELIFWYSKWGQVYTAGGYGCGAALRHHTEYGSCEELFFPYWGVQVSSNHAHVPAPDIAMDRAHFYTQDEVVGLPVGDVEALKQVLRSGRCATFSSDTHGWNTGTGTIEFPDPLDSKGRGGGHCTAVIGFIDRNDLPAHFEGGYFVVRNSWGGDGSTSHLMGPEYGGHLLMPYGWYRRYTSSCYTLADLDHLRETGRRWLAEYYTNSSLKGTPLSVLSGPYEAFWETDGTVLEAEVDKIDFNWGSSGPFQLNAKFPFLPDITLGPADYFSARYTQIHRFRPGWYRFKLRADDGGRLWVDDRLVINAWKPQAATEYVREHYLSGGDHVLRIEYFERTGVASVRFNIEPITFHFDLFANTKLAGSPAASFNDTLTDLEWRHAPPVTTANGQFSLRATAKKHFEAGVYRFHAQHTGGCKIWVGGKLVLNDWNGTNPNGAPKSISKGMHQIKVEFRNLSTLPAPGAKGYYCAALAFDWSEETWQVSIYDDQERKKIHNARYPDVDSLYEAFRTQGLTGTPVFEHRYAANHNVPNQYHAQDGVPLILEFNKLDQFKIGIPGSSAVPNDWLGAHIRRRVFIPAAGRHMFTLRSDDGYRLIVDGKQILQDHHITGADQFNAELDLGVGVHDIAIEYTNTKWNGKVQFRMDRATWQVKYYDGVDFDAFVKTKTLDRVDRIVSERPTAVGDTNYSVRARRTVWLSLGRYRVQVRADDGVRLKIAGLPIIDAWTDQAPTSYWAHFEHRGGNVPIELEYYQKGGGATLEFDLVPDGFFGEYYREMTLQEPEPSSGLDRNVPIAYRFEPAIDFDWGRAGRLPRIGADIFSARWSGQVDLPVGRWSIEVTADDGVRLFLDGRLLIDQWRDQAVTTHKKIIDLVGRKHDLRLEYYEKTGAAVCRLAFKRLF